MKFGFIAHAREVRELRTAFLLRHNISTIPFKSSEALKAKSLEEGLIKDMFTYRKIRSHHNTTCSGKVFCIFLTPWQLLDNQTRAVELVVKACNQAVEWGAEIIGLGAMTAVVGSRGTEINAHSPVPVTTGNSLTVYSTLRTYQTMVKRLEIDPSRQKVVIVGFPGSIALAITRALLKEDIDLILVSRRKTRFLQRFLSELDDAARRRVKTTRDLSDALKTAKIIFSATSTGNIIDPDTLQPGSIVFDIAQPRDVINKKVKRKDILIVDAGTVSLPKTKGTSLHSISLPFLSFIPIPIRTGKSLGIFAYNYSGIGPYYIPSCLAETITLAMEGRRESFSLGRTLELDKINEIGKLSEKHGFVFDRSFHFLSFGKEISQKNYECTRDALKN
jgi:predicted amino acid dehydrogenase